MANDSTKLQYIVELFTQGDTKKATEELNKLNKSAEGVGKGMGMALGGAKELFAFLGGSAFVLEAVNKFVEAERGVNALNYALEQTKNNAPGVRDAVLELADALGDELKVQADDVIKVMTQLVSFGANPKDLKRLTEFVYDLSEVMGRDVPRAARQVSQALRGNFEVFNALGIEIDKTKSATEGFNEAFEKGEKMVSGRGRAAVQGVAGDVKALGVTLEDAQQQLGKWSTMMLTAVANSAAAFGKMTASSTVAEAGKILEGVHDKSRIAIEKEIAAMEKLGTVTAREAEKIRTSLALAFGEDVFDLKDGARDPQPNKPRDLAAEERALGEAGARIGAKGFGGSKPSPPPAGPGAIGTSGLSEEDLKAHLEEIARLDDEIVNSINEQYDARQLVARLADEDTRDSFERFENGERIKQDLIDQTVLVMLDGEARVRAEMEINHDRRISNINSEKFETQEQYDAAIRAAVLLRDEERRRYEEAQSFSGRMKTGMSDLGEQGMHMFANGLGTAMVDAFSEGEKAFQKFFVNFMRQIAEMILQMIIFNALKSGARALGYAGGGQATAAAAGAMIYAASGVSGVSDVSGPTYFPKFNVLAGEAGREVMTVLARPSFERINGVPAQIGYAGGNRLAITSADALAGAGGVMAGSAVVRIELAPGLVASIKNDSIQGARVQIVQDVNSDSPLSKSIRQKFA